MTDQEYPKLFDRIKAVFVDVLVLMALMIIATIIFSSIEDVPDNYRIIAFVFMFILYDPIFISLFGGTLGHMMIDIRVRREKDQGRKILFPLALIRFVVKSLLGWVSLLTVTSNKKKKAIHDSVIGSVVIYKN